ncbi:MAG: hypothetical protein MUF84_18850 [Anaerolineae bacterium]|nr:hypothetical protein [Anaerolineae bacterium]
MGTRCDKVRVLGCNGGDVCAVFDARSYQAHLTMEETEYSYAQRSSYLGNVIRANSLARVNLVERLGTPRADGYLKDFRDAFGRPAHAILLFDLARGIDPTRRAMARVTGLWRRHGAP